MVKHKCTWMWIMHYQIITCTKKSQGSQGLGAIHSDSMLRDLWSAIDIQLILPNIKYLMENLKSKVKC